MAASKVLLGTLGELPADLAEVPIFVAYGDEDDHLRLTVLLSDRFRPASETAAATCRRRSASWRERLEALGELLAAWRPAGPDARAVFVDPDALASDEASSPEAEARFVRERRAFLDAILSSFRRGGWLIVRSAPKRELAVAFEEFEVEAREGTPSALAGLVPATRPMAAWLRDRSALGEATLSRLINAEADPAHSLFERASAELPAFARETAMRLSILRPEQPVNGHYGPLAWSAPDAEWLRPAAVDLLRQAGMLQPGHGRHTLIMPSAIRLQWQALGRERLPAEEAQRDHALVFERLRDAQKIETSIEAHHHAVEANDVAAAIATATYYGSDLRSLAIRLGRAAAATLDPEGFEKAADLYRQIVQQFDAKDAYCWEYLAYNLARAQETGGTRASPEEIESSYRRAHQLDLGNPLFHGRLIGFRAARGEFDASDVDAWMGRYRQLRGTQGVAFFGQPIIDGLRRGGRGKDAAALKRRWNVPPATRRKAPKRPPRFGSARGTIQMAEDFDAPLEELGPYEPD